MSTIPTAELADRPPRWTHSSSTRPWARYAGSRRTCPRPSGPRRLARRPRTCAPARGLAAETAGSRRYLDRRPQPRDRRFTDVGVDREPPPARLVQLYLAGGRTVEQLVADADLDWRDEQRVRFLVENLIEALSPSNVPLVNPASAKAAIDTAGLSLVRGGTQLVKDLASAPRIPEMVDTSGFEVGGNIAATPGRRGPPHRGVRADPVRARRPRRSTRCPLLVVPPTINKFYAIDLAPERSLVEFSVRQGRQMFVISWRNPDGRHADWDFDTYVTAILGRPRRRRARSPAASRPSSAASAPAASWPASRRRTSPTSAGRTGWRRSASR